MHETYPPDVVILLYDLTDSNSFSFVADIFLVNLNNFKKQLTYNQLTISTKKRVYTKIDRFRV